MTVDHALTWGPLAGVAVSLVLCGLALHQSQRAHDTAGTCLDVAEDLQETARRAEEYAQRLEAQATERNDVRWESGLTQTRVWVVTNHGQEAAREVNIVLRIDDEDPIAFDIGDVEGFGHRSVLDLSGWVSEVRKRDAVATRETHGNVVYAGTTTIEVNEHIHWRTPAGAWRTHAPGWRELSV